MALGASTLLAKIADFVTPGSITTTRMPNGASSWASPSLTPSNAYFDATYGDWAIAATLPVSDVMLTIAPLRRSRMPGSTCLRQRIAPHRLMFMTSRYISGVASSATALPPTPALFTSTSTRPAWSRIWANPLATDSSSATSSSTSSILTPAASAILWNVSIRDVARTVPNTVWPCWAR